MSRIRADKFVNNAATDAPELTLGINFGAAGAGGTITATGQAEFAGVCTAASFSGNLTGNADTATTATTATNAQGLTGTPNITVGNIVGAAATFSGVLTYEDVANVDSVGIVTARSGVELGVAGVGGTFSATGFGTLEGGLNVAGVVTCTVVEARVPNIPQNVQASTYTLVKADAGKHINAGGNVTVNSGIFAIGDCISIFNDTTGNITIIQGSSVTLRLVADTGTGTRTLANYGLAAVLCVGSNEFVVSGGGVS